MSRSTGLPNSGPHLRLHRDEPPHREEARRMMQAVLDGEISEDAPRLQELLRLDPVLSAEFDDLQKLDILLTQRPPMVDLSERVLGELQRRKAAPQRISPLLGGLAAAVALGSAALWLVVGNAGHPAGSTMPTLAANVAPVPVGAPSSSSEESLIDDARLAIQQTTGRPVRGVPRDMFTRSLGSPSDVLGEMDQTTRRFVAQREASFEPPIDQAGRAVAISRTGMTFVNPGPSRTPVAKLANDPMLGQIVGGSDWQPGATRRRDNARFLISGWHDSDGNTLPGAVPRR